RYSAANALLIYKQCPEATQLKDFDGWRDDNVRIKKGAKSISILEPVDFTRADGTQGVSYNVKKVFDVSQTNGKRPSSPTVNRDPQNLIKIMLRTAPVNFESVDNLTDPNAVAFYDNDRNTLLVKRHVNNSVALFQGVALELGYAELSTRSESFSRKDMSYQAVCVGYMICKKYGVEAKSFAIDRIPAQWKEKEPKEVRAELSKMRTAMSDIHSRVSEEIYRQQQERSVDRSR
ncbi:MAG: LtrC-like protein, partial [Clostridia bacterium]|nr:LtrC-like protein [Clostridia bacterium]